MDKSEIVCPACQKSFERCMKYLHCTNCFACTGCEIYYCPFCDERIVIKPVKTMASTTEEPPSSNSL